MFKKLFLKTHTEATQEIEAIETYVVEWVYFERTYGGDIRVDDYVRAKPKYQAFTNYDNAVKFKNQINDAYKLLGIKSQAELYKQENGL